MTSLEAGWSQRSKENPKPIFVGLALPVQAVRFWIGGEMKENKAVKAARFSCDYRNQTKPLQVSSDLLQVIQ